MTEEQHLREYTRALKPHLPRDAFQPVPRRLLWLPVYLGTFILAAWGVTQTDLIPLKLLLSLVIAQAFTALGFLAHEILHGQVTKNPLIRSIAGTLAFLPLGVGARLWRKWHNVEHHGHTQHPEDDPDAMGTLEAMRERPFLQRFYRLAPGLRSLLTFLSFSFWFSFHALMMLRRFLPEFKGRERRVVLAQAVLPLLVWGGLLLWIGPADWAFVYLLPLLLTNFTVMSYIATNHLLNPLTHTNDPLLNSLTVRNPRWLEWLHLNFGYHTEHHVFPAMNPIHAPRVAALLKEMWPERYNELPHWKALYYLWKTPRLYRDERNLIELSTNRVFGTLGFGLEETLKAPKAPPTRTQQRRAVD
ncbi:fatty acid desaturase family protein [Marinithermus hydrothermalis]|uniref:Fatty acid desaturase n=1 Tax=Marinithermus hydrothermalis (strain DSM 14884 / JCM 11576 / T1) TaxID=869210 RepID=F2NKU3_MARHT|nr:acyl-CoA desaturase [Marinithermus hydrothermalis]AEB10856.1 fatty acid desaturase [Marinithermus hydrothermalis DSM 14884]